MKIICKKGCSLKSALQIMSEYIEKKGLEYPLISGGFGDRNLFEKSKGEEYTGNNQTVYFDEKELPFRNCVPTENEPINMHSQCIKTRSGYFPHIEIYT